MATTTSSRLPPRLPVWQPDHSAKSCPLCLTPFTFFNRRHHCRRCGRVVCASCSPHRISIPRAFVVRPPKAIDITRHGGGDGEDEDEDEGDDEEEEEEEGDVRICQECLVGGAGISAVDGGGGGGGGGGGFGASGSRPVEMPPQRRRRRQSSQGGRSNPPTVATPHHPRHPHQHPHPHQHQHPHSHSVPQLAEEDYCPICHRALPYLRDPSDAGREAHIASCIAAATSPSPPFSAVGRSRSYTNGGRMVVWNADLKDCSDPATGDPVECVICFEEFDVGCEIARLECLCRYHKKCIRDWFDRKGSGECPTHAIHE